MFILTAIAMNKSWSLNVELIWDCFSSFLNFQNIYTESLARRKYLLDMLLTSSPHLTCLVGEGEGEERGG